MNASRPNFRSRLTAALSQRPQRAVVLPMVAVLVGVVIAATGVFRRAAPRVLAVPPGYVALVNQKGVLMSDFIAQTETETVKSFAQTTSAERSRVLGEMIDEELLVQRGLLLDLPETTTEIRGAMVSAVDAQAAAPVLATAPTDDDLRGFYDRNRSKYTADGTMQVHDLLLGIGGYRNVDQSTAQAETDANEAVYQLRSGAAIEYVMEHFGFADSGRSDNTEQLDFAAKLHLGEKLYQVATTMADGAVSDPILDTDGIHVLVMDHRNPPRIAEFAAVRDQVYSDYRQAQSKNAAAENLKFLRSQAQIILAPGQTQ